MDRRSWLWCVGGWALGARSAAWGQEPVNLSRVIDRAIEAAGGEAALTRLQAQTWKSRMTLHEEPETRVIEARYWVQWPDRIRSEVEGGQTLVRNGKEAWLKQSGAVHELNGDQLRFLIEDMHVNWLRTLIPLQAKGVRYESVPAIEVDGRPTIGMRVITKGHRDVVLLFDKETYLLLKMESKSRGLGTDGELSNIETYFSEYEDTACTKAPTRVRIIRDGELYMEIENTEIRRVESLPGELFAKPEEGEQGN